MSKTATKTPPTSQTAVKPQSKGKKPAAVEPLGGELGTSTSKFCAGQDVVTFTSTVGDALPPSMELNWRRMNRSRDKRWVKNLAVFDDKRRCWRYVGAMTRSSEKPSWFTERGVLQNFDDAYLALISGIFLLSQARTERGEAALSEIGMGFGIPVKAGERSAEDFFALLRRRVEKSDGKSFLNIKTRNVATGEEQTLRVRLNFIALQFQAYGAYMVHLFRRFGMKIYNTYVIDVGHGTWIKLPILDNEVDMVLADSQPEGMHAITSNISKIVYEKSGGRFKVPERRIMEKLPRGDFRIEIPGEGVFDFGPLLEAEASAMADRIAAVVRSDVAALSDRGAFIDYFAIVGGGAHLLGNRIRERIRQFFGWTPKLAKERVLSVEDLGLESRIANAVGFMLLARDQIAVENDTEVETDFDVANMIEDYPSK